MTTNQGFTNFICSNLIVNEYLLMILKYMTPKLISLAGGSTFLEISKKDIRNLDIPVPSVDEQKNLVTKFNKFSLFLKKCSDQINNQKQVFNSISSEIFN